jgi:hypothetical protein
MIMILSKMILSGIGLVSPIKCKKLLDKMLPSNVNTLLKLLRQFRWITAILVMRISMNVSFLLKDSFNLPTPITWYQKHWITKQYQFRLPVILPSLADNNEFWVFKHFSVFWQELSYMEDLLLFLLVVKHLVLMLCIISKNFGFIYL